MIIYHGVFWLCRQLHQSYTAKTHTWVSQNVLFLSTDNAFTENYQQSLIRRAVDWRWLHESCMLVMCIHFLSLSPVTAVIYSHKHKLESQEIKCFLIQTMCLLQTITNSCSGWRLSGGRYMSFCMLSCHGHFWSLSSATAITYSHKHTLESP